MHKTETDYLTRISDWIVLNFIQQTQGQIFRRFGHPTDDLKHNVEESYRAAYDTLREYGQMMLVKGRAEMMAEMRASIEAQRINAGSAHVLNRSDPIPATDK